MMIMIMMIVIMTMQMIIDHYDYDDHYDDAQPCYMGCKCSFDPPPPRHLLILPICNNCTNFDN